MFKNQVKNLIKKISLSYYMRRRHHSKVNKTCETQIINLTHLTNIYLTRVRI